MSTRQKLILGILMILGIMACKIAWAETYVYGTITGDTTWNLTGSPYIATDTVYVADGVRLTIEPGVTVRFATETFLISYGTLNAIGTSDGTITFTSDQATYTPGHWKGIKLSGSGAQGSQIKYCDIGYAKQAVYLENVFGIVIMNNYIHDNKGNDGGPGSQPGDIGCGIYIYSSNNNSIGSNTIKANRGGSGGEATSGTGGPAGIGAGIYLSSSTNNTIYSNIVLANTGGSGGTGTYPWGRGAPGGVGAGIYLSSSSNNTIYSNTASANTGGFGGNCGWSGSVAGCGGVGAGIYLSSSSNNTIASPNPINPDLYPQIPKHRTNPTY